MTGWLEFVERDIIRRMYSDGGWDGECLRCGKPITLFYNGGELDERQCCGLVYRTRAIGFELVIADPPPLDNKPKDA